MTDEIKELISKADRGDSEAQKELMKRGDAASSAGDHEQAAFFYKMAAMAYRIKAGRTGSHLSDSAESCAWLARELKYYDAWVKKYTRPLAPRLNRFKTFEKAGIASSGILGLRRDEKFRPMVFYVEKKLMERGIEFCAPGGTINRHIFHMARGHEAFAGLVNDIDIRVALDPLCDEIERRYHNPPEEPVLGNDSSDEEDVFSF